MDFILSCMATTAKSVLGGFFFCIALVLLGLGVYGFNWVRHYIKDAIEKKHDMSWDKDDENF